MGGIYIFGTRGFPGVQGGVEKHCEYLYPELADAFPVTVFRRKPFLPKEKADTYKGIHFIDLPSTRIKGFESFYHSFLCAFYCLFKRPAIVHIHNIGPAMFTPLLKLGGLKVVLTYHSPNYEHKKWGFFARNVLKISEWLATRGADRIIFVNLQQMRKFSPAIQQKAVLIPNGVHIQGKSPATDYLTSLHIEPDKYILAVGRITQEKGLDYLIDAFVKSGQEDCRLVLAGGIDHSSKYAVNLQKKMDEYGIVTTGYVDGENLRQLYSHARLFVLPSYNEGFPLVLLEAMSYQLPILASDIPANKQLGLDESAYFKTGDTDDLAGHLEQELKKEKQNVSYDLSRYTWPGVARQTAAVYTSIIENFVVNQ